MAYTEILKFLGSIVRWAASGFRKSFGEFYDDKFERQNFVAGVVAVLLFFLAVVPLVALVVHYFM